MSTTTWVADPAHSEITFKVKHMMIANVNGEFRNFDVHVVTDGDDFSKAVIRATVDTSSIFTNSTDRDNHLRSGDFFDTDNHREMVFESSSFHSAGDETYRLDGMLTIRGISKPVTLDVEFGGINKDPWGNMKAGFSVTGRINRKEWGLNWNAALEAGGVLVSDEVRISAEVQLAKKQ